MEGDGAEIGRRVFIGISIHALRVEGDASHADARPKSATNFYPRPPGGGRRKATAADTASLAFLSTPSGWRATCLKSIATALMARISIHALRVEGDLDSIRHLLTPSISIHALRVEGDLSRLRKGNAMKKFLSTPSGWRATKFRLVFCTLQFHFYPRPPGGGRRITPCRASPCRRFLSTPSGWRATGWSRAFGRAAIQISIHALRVEGDAFKQLFCIKSKIFLSTPSGWRATCR